MRKILKARYYITACVMALVAISFQSCSEEESFDVVGSSENKVYLNTQSWNPVNMPKNSVIFNVTNTPLGSIVANTGKVEMKLGVQCTHPAASDIKVKLELDNSLVMEGFKILPSGVSVATDKTELTIPKGDIWSMDSMTISVNTDDLDLLEADSYMVPVKITTVTNAGVSANLKNAYVVINAQESNCYENPAQGDMVGQIVSNRSAWSASLSVPPSSGALTRLFDGNTRNYFFVTPAARCQLTVDLAAEYTNITGVRIHSYSASYGLTSIDVYSSADGENWTSQGNAVLSTSSSYQYIKFYSPINARYIKLDVKGWRSPTYVIMAEFDIYTN